MQIMNNFSPKFRGTITVQRDEGNVCFNTNNITYESKGYGKTCVSAGNKEYNIPVSYNTFDLASRQASASDNVHVTIDRNGETYKFKF